MSLKNLLSTVLGNPVEDSGPFGLKETLVTNSNSVFIRLIAIPLATFCGSQWGIEASKHEFNSDNTKSNAEVSPL